MDVQGKRAGGTSLHPVKSPRKAISLHPAEHRHFSLWKGLPDLSAGEIKLRHHL